MQFSCMFACFEILELKKDEDIYIVNWKSKGVKDIDHILSWKSEGYILLNLSYYILFYTQHKGFWV